MNSKYITFILICSIGFFSTGNSNAQGVVFLENTDQPTSGAWTMGMGQAIVGTEFQTGTNTGGYNVNSLQLLFADAVGNPSFSSLLVTLCQNAGGNPGDPLYYFNAEQNPLTAGLYTFDATPNTFLPDLNKTLASNTDYWLIVAVTSGITGTAYNLSYTSETSALSPDGWANVGSIAAAQGGLPMFSITATSVPEPSIFALLVMTFIGMAWLCKCSRIKTMKSFRGMFLL